MAAEEEFSAITDKIPQRPVTFVEGTSYTMVIVAALGVSLILLHVIICATPLPIILVAECFSGLDFGMIPDACYKYIPLLMLVQTPQIQGFSVLLQNFTGHGYL